MSKLDEVKEILNTLRVAMSLSFGMLVIVVSGIIARFDQERVDVIFWLGCLFSVFLLVVIFLLTVKISQKTKEKRSCKHESWIVGDYWYCHIDSSSVALRGL